MRWCSTSERRSLTRLESMDLGWLARRTRHTFSSVFGAVIVAGEDYREVFQYLIQVSVWKLSVRSVPILANRRHSVRAICIRTCGPA